MYDSLTNAYYLHYFSRKQPDLNWENPQVRQEVYGIMKFWADKGIDGFRLDAFQFVAKDTTFPGFPANFEEHFTLYYAMQGNLHGYLQEMNREIFSKYNVMSVAEGAGNSFEDAHNLVDAERHELNMAYAFDGVDIATRNGYSLLRFKEVFGRWDSAFAKKGWISIFLSNHDQARLVSSFGNDHPAFREASAKLLATFIMTMRGTPFYYNGDELGMTNARFDKIGDYRDMQILNEYRHQQNIGGDLQKFMATIEFESRDNGRTPFQWDSSANAGFTTGTPWIRVNPNYKKINEASEEVNPNSCLNYFRRLVKLRKNNLTLVYGKYMILDKNNPKIFAYLREGEGMKILVLLNFSASEAQANVGLPLINAKLLLSNYPDFPTPNQGGEYVKLRPYEAIISKL